MNRRTVLTAALSAPAVALAGSLPVVAAAQAPATREFMLNLAALHGELEAQQDRWSSIVDLDDERMDEATARVDELTGHLQRIEQAMLATPAQTLTEFAAKVAVLAQPYFAQPEWLDHLRAEARALVA